MNLILGLFNLKKINAIFVGAMKTVSGMKKKLKDTYIKHHEEKRLSRLEKGKDNTQAQEGAIILAVYDLQAVLPVSVGAGSAFFYKSRMNCFNFTVSIHHSNFVCVIVPFNYLYPSCLVLHVQMF